MDIISISVMIDISNKFRYNRHWITKYFFSEHIDVII